MQEYEYILKLKKLIEKERIEDESVTKDEILRLDKEKRERKGRAITKIVNQENTHLEKEGIFRFKKESQEKFPHLDIGVGDTVLVSEETSNNPIDSGVIGEIVSKSDYHIDICFQRISNFLKTKILIIHKYTNESTYKIQTEYLTKIKDWSEEKTRLKGILLEEKHSRIREIEPLRFFDETLNQSQKESVTNAIKEIDMFLIVGPPGCGKTKTATEIIRQLVKQNKKILVCADSNIAVDNILEYSNKYCNCVRLGNSPKTLESVEKCTLNYKIKHHPDYNEYERHLDNIKFNRSEQKRHIYPSKELRNNLNDIQILKNAEREISMFGISVEDTRSMSNWIKYQAKIKESMSKLEKIRNKIEEEIIEESEVVFATNTGSHKLKDEFDILIIDEAAQSTECSCIVPISKVKKVILIGDHNQLPPTVLSKDAKELQISLFERMLKISRSTLLDTSYRMTEKINKIASELFYEGKLKTEIKENDEYYTNFPYKSPIVFVNIDSKEQKYQDQSSYFNEKEIEKIFDIVTKYPKEKITGNDIGIISPYLEQVKKLNEKFIGFEIKTVDGFQGREKNIIILSLVRSNNNGELGFLKDYRRLNVAITRARKQLIIVGNKDTLIKDEKYKRLIEYIEQISKEY
ncbi:MAG: IGHMBP2 family helicase [Candidatus Woesearchaeota archaeon]|jgi:predicted DNA helicase